MPKYYLYECDKCSKIERRYRNVRRCKCGGNLTRVEVDAPLQIPDVIYLQIEDDGEPLAPQNWMHCFDRVNDSDVKYVKSYNDDTAWCSHCERDTAQVYYAADGEFMPYWECQECKRHLPAQ